MAPPFPICSSSFPIPRSKIRSARLRGRTAYSIIWGNRSTPLTRLCASRSIPAAACRILSGRTPRFPLKKQRCAWNGSSAPPCRCSACCPRSFWNRSSPSWCSFSPSSPCSPARAGLTAPCAACSASCPSATTPRATPSSISAFCSTTTPIPRNFTRNRCR